MNSFTSYLDDFKSTAYWLSLRGWSEAAGGNLSLRIDLPETAGENIDSEAVALPFSVPHLAGMGLMLTGSGTRAREIGVDPIPDVGIYKISDKGDSYRWIQGNNNPSMELPAHCAIHNALAEHRPEDKAIMHTHPASIIALFHVEEFNNSKAISDKILSLQSEARLILPEGVGFVSHELPGSLELGFKSAEQVKNHHLVMWQLHGCLATGSSLAHAFDLLEVFEKSASIYWQLRAAGIDPVGIPSSDIEETLIAFGKIDRYKNVQ